MTVREIQGFMAEMYADDVSPDLISSVTDAVMSEVAAWQARPLEAMDPVVFFDALRVKIRENGVVRNKAVYLALGVLADGTRDILGIWIENTEGAKFWMKVFNDMKTRGCNDVLIAVTDGLKGMGEALGAGAQARASGYMGAANAIGGGIGQYMGYQQNQATNSLLNQVLANRTGCGGYGRPSFGGGSYSFGEGEY
jgi:hypothetical protein